MDVQSPSDLVERISSISAIVTEAVQEIQRLRVENESLRTEIERLRPKPEERPPEPAIEARVSVKAPESGIVAFGHVFRPGRVRGLAARRPGGPEVPVQVKILRTAPDGSVRHALLAADVEAGYEGPLELLAVPKSREESWSGPSALSAEARITADGREYVARPEGEGDVWAEGGLVSVRRFLAPFTSPEGDVHPRLQAVFDAVFTKSGPVWAAVGIEHCWAAAAVEPVVYGAHFVCEGREHREERVRHVPFTRWRQVFDLGGLGEARLDPRYLVSTAAVPSYDVERYTASDKALDRLVKPLREMKAAVLGSGVVFPSMNSGGMTRLDIGPLPGWDAAAVLSQDPRAFAVSRAAGEASAHFPVHYRDRATGLPYSVVDHPTASIHPNNSGSREEDRLPVFHMDVEHGLRPDMDHAPSLGYLPYLLQPWDRWMLEEVHFWVGYHQLSRPWKNGYRNGAEGLLRTGALRGYAWAIRNLALAAWITPDGHPHRERLETILDNNLESSAAETSPLGWWGSGRKSGPGTEWMAEDVTDLTVPWQHDFGVVVWDWMVRLGYPKAAAFRDLLVRGLRGRFLEQPNRCDGTAQHFAVVGKDGPYASWAEIHRKTFERRPAEKTPADFWHPNRPFDYGAVARAALHRAVHGAGAEDLRPVLEQLDASCERFAEAYDADPRWRIV